MLPFRTARAHGVPAPTANSVDLWTIDLDRPDHIVVSLEAVLDQSERRRARRLWEGPLRSRFIVAHAAARQILARYVGGSAAGLQFDRMPSGKPCLQNGAVSFSLSHSGNLAVLAVTCAGRVGVDLELVRPVSGADNILAQLFTAAEARQYASFAPADRPAAWFSGWTRKSALLKATGQSVSDRQLSSLEVDLSPSATSPTVISGADTWFMRSFSPAQGFTAAIAGDFPIEIVNRLEWVGPADIERPATVDSVELAPVSA